MAISLDQLNAAHVPSDVFTDRWMFHLVDEFRGPHAGAVFDNGKTVEPVDLRVMRKFVVNFGARMIGAKRVVGEPAELGDCRAFGVAATEPAIEADETSDETVQDEDTAPSAPKAKKKSAKK